MQSVGGGLGLDMFRKWKHGVVRAKCRACDVATQLGIRMQVIGAKRGISWREIHAIPGLAQLTVAMRNRNV